MVPTLHWQLIAASTQYAAHPRRSVIPEGATSASPHMVRTSASLEGQGGRDTGGEFLRYVLQKPLRPRSQQYLCEPSAPALFVPDV